MKIPVLMDSRMKSKIEDVMEWNNDVYSVKFKDLDDAFWFGSKVDLQEFLNNQAQERFYDKELRKGYFDYVNDAGETLRYHIKSNRGTLTLLEEECLGVIAV
jgi:hypothetical protein